MWTIWLFACDNTLYPELEWLIDHTLVPGIRVDPEVAARGAPRTVDALVLSPHEVRSVAVDTCGVVVDQPAVIDGTCFNEPSLVSQLADGLPATVEFPTMTYPCDLYVTYGDTGNAPVYVANECHSTFPLRVRAVTDEDEGYGVVSVDVPADERPGTTTVDPSTYDLQVAVVGGEVLAGSEVVLEASELNVPWPEDFVVRWYVDAGELLATGRTAYIGRNEARARTQNTLRIPDDWRGPLRVAVVTRSGTVWTVSTLEVP